MKTICIYHSRDLDGWMSAAIIKKWFIEKYNNDYQITDRNIVIEPDEVLSNNKLDMLGWDYGDKIPDLSEYDKVIMCDVSFPKEEMWKLRSNLGKNFIWIDHHKSSINENIPKDHKESVFEGVQNVDASACELTWMYFNKPYKMINEELDWEGMPEIVRLLGRYDCFGHKGTEEEQKVLEFQYGARQLIDNYKEAYIFLVSDKIITMNGTELSIVDGIMQRGEHIYNYLCTEAKQTYKKAFEIELRNIIETRIVQQVPFKFLCVNQERFNPINFGINYHEEEYDGFACFWYKDGKWMWSLYNDNGNVDCSKIAKLYGGGGHKGAAGMVVDTETMLKIINKN